MMIYDDPLVQVLQIPGDYRADGADYMDDDQIADLVDLLYYAGTDSVDGVDYVPMCDWGWRESPEYWRSLVQAMVAHGIPRRVIVQMLMAALPGVRRWAQDTGWCFSTVIGGMGG